MCSRQILDSKYRLIISVETGILIEPNKTVKNYGLIIDRFKFKVPKNTV